MRTFNTTVEALDKKAPAKPKFEKLHPVQFRNFFLEHGRMAGEQRTILHFIQVREEPDKFLERLRRVFEGRIKPKVSYDNDVMLGGYQDMGIQDSFSVVWEEELSDGMLGWIRNKIQQMDKDMDSKKPF